MSRAAVATIPNLFLAATLAFSQPFESSPHLHNLSLGMRVAAPSPPAEPSPDVQSMLHNNLDKIEFSSLTISRTVVDQYGYWLCGTMTARLATGSYGYFQFVAQIFPDQLWKEIPGFSQSWINLWVMGWQTLQTYIGRIVIKFIGTTGLVASLLMLYLGQSIHTA